MKNYCPVSLSCDNNADKCCSIFERKEFDGLPEVFKNYKPITNRDKQFFTIFKEITCQRICSYLNYQSPYLNSSKSSNYVYFSTTWFNYFKEDIIEKYSKQKIYDKNKYRRKFNDLDVDEVFEEKGNTK